MRGKAGLLVIPAKAGISCPEVTAGLAEIPACAGMTMEKELDPRLRGDDGGRGQIAFDKAAERSSFVGYRGELMATAQVAADAPISVRRSWLPDALPSLRGLWLALYTIAWAGALALALIGPFRAAERMYERSAQPSWALYGLLNQSDQDGPYITAGYTDEARRAGVRLGDRITAIDGISTAGASSAGLRERLLGVEGSARFSLRSADGAVRQVRLSRSEDHAAARNRLAGISRSTEIAMVLFSILVLPAFLVPAAVLLLVRRRREAVPAFLSLGFLLICGTDFYVQGADLGMPDGASGLLAGAGWVLLLLAILAFPDGRFVPRWTRFAAPVLLLTPLVVARYNGLLLVGAEILLVAAALVLRYRRLGAGAERQQLRVAFFGFFIGMLLLALIVPPLAAWDALMAADPRWEVWLTSFAFPLFSTALPMMAVGLMVSILRYRLYDADALISRSVTYGALTVLLLAIFAASQRAIEALGEAYFGGSLGAMAGAIGAAVAAVMIVPLHNRVSRWAEKKFQKQLIRLRQGLPTLVGDLRETAGLERIAAAVLDSVTQGVRASRAALTVGDELVEARGIERDKVEAWRAGWTPAAHDGLDCDRGDPLLPMRVPLEADGHGRVGWLLLGPRPDGSFYGRDEREALAEIADSVARALEIVRARGEHDEKLKRRLTAIEARLAAAPSKGKPRRSK